MRRILVLASAAILLVNCSKSEADRGTESGADKPIKAVAAIEGLSSKAVISGTNAILAELTFLRLDDLETAKTGSFDFSGVSEITGGSRAANGAIGFGATQNYDKAGDKTTYMRGFTTDNAVVTSGNSAVWTIDGATDILLTDVWNAGRYSAPGNNEMVFRHQLSRIEVICQGEENVAASVVQANWGDITSIGLVDAMPTLTYTYSTNAVTASGAKADFALLAGTEYDASKAFAATAIPAYGNTAVCGSAMVCPQTSVVKLKVTTAKKGEKEVTTSLNSLDRANIHRITLTFNADGVTVGCSVSTIEEWADGSPGTGTVPSN